MAHDWDLITPLSEAAGEHRFDWVLATAPEVLPRLDSDLSRANVLALMATAHQRRGEWVKGIEAATRALQLDPKLAYVRCTRALCYMRQGQLRLAVADTTRAIEINRRDAVALYVRAAAHALLALRGEGETRRLCIYRALADVQESLVHRPGDEPARQLRDELVYALGGERWSSFEQETLDTDALSQMLMQIADRFAVVPTP